MNSIIQNGEGVERARARRDAKDASGVMYVDGSIYEGMEACLVRSGKTVAHVVKYADAVEIAETVQSLAREPTTADVGRVCLPPDDYDVQLMLKGGMPGCPCCERTATTFSRFFPHSGIYQAYVHCAHCDVQVLKNARDHDEARRLAADAWAKRPALSRAAPSSEPAIAEGERVMSRQTAYAFCGKLKQSQKAEVSERLGFKLDYSLPTLERDKQFLHKVSKAKAVGILEAAIASFLPGEFAALAQSSTPSASKGVEADDIDRAQGVGQDELVAGFKRALQHPAGDHDGWTDAGLEDAFFRWPVIVNALNEALAASPTPSNDTLQGRGEVTDAVTVLDVFLAAYRKQPDAELVNRKGSDDLLTWGDLRVLLAALQKDPRHDG